MQENAIKKAIREDRIAVGTQLAEFATRGTPQILEYAGLDWVMIDMEHSGFTLDKVADLISWFKATPITVLVRPPENLHHLLSGIMDAGAMGVQVANVESAADARACVDAVMYPPLGNRGLGLNAAHSGFTKPKASEYMPARNAQTSVVAMIESRKGLDNIDEIAAVEGIDMIHPSSNDLSQSLGVLRQYEHPTYKAALKRIAEACQRHGKALKYIPFSDENLAEMYAMGCRVMGVRGVVDAVQDALKGDADHVRDQVTKISKKR